MSKEILVITAISEVVSMILIIFIWKRPRSLTLKVISSVAVIVPVVGPIFYVFFEGGAPSQTNLLTKNDLPRGEYTQRWIFIRSVFNKKDGRREFSDRRKK